MRMRVLSLASISGLRIRLCQELWCKLQTWLGSRVAVAVRLEAIALIRPLAWEPPYAEGAALKRHTHTYHSIVEANNSCHVGLTYKD